MSQGFVLMLNLFTSIMVTIMSEILFRFCDHEINPLVIVFDRSTIIFNTTIKGNATCKL